MAYAPPAIQELGDLGEVQGESGSKNICSDVKCVKDVKDCIKDDCKDICDC